MTTGKQNSFGVFFGKVRRRNKLTLREFCRRAGADPANIMDDEDLVRTLPTFFNTLRGERPTPAEMRRIAERIRKAGA